jgi:hypothetical protein
MNTRFFKSIAVTSIIFLIVFPLVTRASSKTYYDGDAIAYRDKIVIGSTNMNGLEVFVVEGKSVKRIIAMHTFEYTYGGGKDFTDLGLRQEDDRLYLYATNGRSLFKYNISDLRTAKLERTYINTFWDNMIGLKSYDDKLVTIGSNGVSLYNNNLKIIDSFKVYNNHQTNIDFGYFGKRIYSIVGNDLQIYSTTDRRFVATTTIRNLNGLNRKTWSVGQYLYLVDDKSLLKIDLAGTIVKRQKLNGPLGFDVAGSYGNNVAYYSNGQTVTKFKLGNLATVKTVNVNGLVKNVTNWAIGLNVVKTSQGERVIVFDNEAIVVLDANLKLIASQKIVK